MWYKLGLAIPLCSNVTEWDVTPVFASYADDVGDNNFSHLTIASYANAAQMCRMVHMHSTRVIIVLEIPEGATHKRNTWLVEEEYIIQKDDQLNC